MKTKMNTWSKVGILAAVTPVVWVILVKAVDVSRTPEELRNLRGETREGFKQVNGRLDLVIGATINTNDAVGKR